MTILIDRTLLATVPGCHNVSSIVLS